MHQPTSYVHIVNYRCGGIVYIIHVVLYVTHGSVGVRCIFVHRHCDENPRSPVGVDWGIT